MTQPAGADEKGTVLPDSEVFSRSINMKFQSLVLYPDGTYDRRASFYPDKKKKHWATTTGTWSKTADGQYCLKRKSVWFHDKDSSNVHTDGSCVLIYRTPKGVVRADIQQINGQSLDRSPKFLAASDGFHFPSVKALQASGAKQLSPNDFVQNVAARRYVVNQWIGVKNFVPTRKPVFTISQVANGQGLATDRRGKTTAATITAKGRSLCTFFKFKNLWADGCGTVWQTPDGRIYVISDESGYAYMGGQIQ